MIKATRYLASDAVLAVERHGRPSGFFIPVTGAPEKAVIDRIRLLPVPSLALLTAQKGRSVTWLPCLMWFLHDHGRYGAASGGRSEA